MKRVFDTLNQMSFTLPKGYHLTDDKYTLPNGQGFINKENYLSDDGEVISFFELHRSKDEFFESYDSLCKDAKTLSQKYELEKNFSIRLGDFVFPVYIIRSFLLHILEKAFRIMLLLLRVIYLITKPAQLSIHLNEPKRLHLSHT